MTYKKETKELKRINSSALKYKNTYLTHISNHCEYQTNDWTYAVSLVKKSCSSDSFTQFLTGNLSFKHLKAKDDLDVVLLRIKDSQELTSPRFMNVMQVCKKYDMLYAILTFLPQDLVEEIVERRIKKIFSLKT
jgi:hypothetical protein